MPEHKGTHADTLQVIALQYIAHCVACLPRIDMSQNDSQHTADMRDRLSLFNCAQPQRD
jgi:hypothetical protein